MGIFWLVFIVTIQNASLWFFLLNLFKYIFLDIFRISWYKTLCHWRPEHNSFEIVVEKWVKSFPQSCFSNAWPNWGGGRDFPLSVIDHYVLIYLYFFHFTFHNETCVGKKHQQDIIIIDHGQVIDSIKFCLIGSRTAKNFCCCLSIQ